MTLSNDNNKLHIPSKTGVEEVTIEAEGAARQYLRCLSNFKTSVAASFKNIHQYYQ